jgi:Tfp pilus assembly protein PilN
VIAPSTITPEPESAPQPDALEVLVLPAEYFFIEQVEVPSALAANELADFAELSIEAIAPFPLEQLRWGFLTAPDGNNILIYAALRDRLKRAGHGDLETYTWVLPDFATLHGARFSRDVEVTLAGEAFDTCFFHPSGEAIPENIRSQPLDATAPTASGQSLRLRALPVALTEKGTPIFQFETVGEEPASGHWSPLKPDEATLWQADIRPADYKSVERSARRTTALVTRILGYAGLFALLLILLEGLIFGGQFWLGTRQAKIDAQSTDVRRVEDKQTLMNKLEQVAQNELRPIAILEAANQIRINLGDTGIEYDEVKVEGGNRIEIEGKSNTINELNAYTESLRQSGNFKLIDTPESSTRSGKTTFKVNLDYIHSAPEPEADVGAPLVTPAEAQPAEPVATPKPTTLPMTKGGPQS